MNPSIGLYVLDSMDKISSYGMSGNWEGHYCSADSKSPEGGICRTIGTKGSVKGGFAGTKEKLHSHSWRQLLHLLFLIGNDILVNEEVTFSYQIYSETVDSCVITKIT